jgi:hypothetical protein
MMGMQSMVHECPTQRVQLCSLIAIEFTRYLHEDNLSQPEKSWQSYEFFRSDSKMATIGKHEKEIPP